MIALNVEPLSGTQREKHCLFEHSYLELLARVKSGNDWGVLLLSVHFHSWDMKKLGILCCLWHGFATLCQVSLISSQRLREGYSVYPMGIQGPQGEVSVMFV